MFFFFFLLNPFWQYQPIECQEFKLIWLIVVARDIQSKWVLPVHNGLLSQTNISSTGSYIYIYIYIYIAQKKMAHHSKIVIRAIPLKFSNLENKAISSSICKQMICYRIFTCAEHYSLNHPNSQYNRGNYEIFNIMEVIKNANWKIFSLS